MHFCCHKKHLCYWLLKVNMSFVFISTTRIPATTIQQSNREGVMSVILVTKHLKYYVKACVCYFLSNFYFSTYNDSPLKTEKCFLFHLKSSFCTRDIQFLAVFSLPFYTFQIPKDKWKWNNLVMN